MTVEELLARALDRWPGLDAEGAFRERLALDGEELEDLFAEDLYVACAALGGHSSAIERVGQLLSGQMVLLAGFRLRAEELEDVRASIMASLVVGQSPRLTRYSGRGPLEAWLRVVATREVLTWVRLNKREVIADDDALLGSLEMPSEAPELAHLKSQYKGAFSAAFRAAIAELSPRERNLLRQHYLDTLTLEELATLYRVHRSTAVRWLASARAELLERTRREISRSLGLPISQIDTLIRVMQSRFDLSASMFLATGPRT